VSEIEAIAAGFLTAVGVVVVVGFVLVWWSEHR
jgi:hypothetical protein